MKNILISTIIALMAISLGLYAQEKGNAQEEPKVKLELVWEKEFEKGIINVAFSDDMTIVVTEDKIFSLDNESREIKYLRPTYPDKIKPSWRRTWVYPSKNGRYIGFYHHVYFNERSKKFNTEKKRLAVFELIDNSGKPMWRNEKEIHPEAEFYSPSLAASNQGYIVETDLDWHGKLYFYNPLGKLIKEVKVSENQFENCVTHGETWSYDGNYFAIFTDEGIKDECRSYVILYTKAGEHIWKSKSEKGIENSYVDDISISQDNKRLLSIKRFRFVRVFDVNGKILWEYKIRGKGSAKIKISKDQSRLAVFSTIGLIYLFDLKNGELIWQKTFDDMDITSIAISSKGKYIIAGMKEKHGENSTISIINNTRDIKSTYKFEEPARPSDSLNRIANPNLFLDDDRNQLIIVFENKIYSYKVCFN